MGIRLYIETDESYEALIALVEMTTGLVVDERLMRRFKALDSFNQYTAHERFGIDFDTAEERFMKRFYEIQFDNVFSVIDDVFYEAPRLLADGLRLTMEIYPDADVNVHRISYEESPNLCLELIHMHYSIMYPEALERLKPHIIAVRWD